MRSAMFVVGFNWVHAQPEQEMPRTSLARSKYAIHRPQACRQSQSLSPLARRYVPFDCKSYPPSLSKRNKPIGTKRQKLRNAGSEHWRVRVEFPRPVQALAPPCRRFRVSQLEPCTAANIWWIGGCLRQGTSEDLLKNWLDMA